MSLSSMLYVFIPYAVCPYTEEWNSNEESINNRHYRSGWELSH